MKKQCRTCPWRVGAVTDDIPGYDLEKHRALADTVAVEGDVTNVVRGRLPMMACHYSTEGDDRVCVGWLHNQLGSGNNIALRLAASRDPSLARYVLDGEQREAFSDTFARRGDR